MDDKSLQKLAKERKLLPRDVRSSLEKADKWFTIFLNQVNLRYFDGFLTDYRVWFADLEFCHGFIESEYKIHNIVLDYKKSVFYSMRSAKHEFAHLADWMMGVRLGHGISFLKQLLKMNGCDMYNFKKDVCFVLNGNKLYQIKILGYFRKIARVYFEIPSFNEAHYKKIVYSCCYSNIFTRREILKMKKLNKNIVYPEDFFSSVIECDFTNQNTNNQIQVYFVPL